MRRLLAVALLTWCLQMAVVGSACWGMPMDDDDAAIFFGPRGQPYYAAAYAIETGQFIPAAALAGIKPDIDRKLQQAQLTLLQFAWEKGNVPAIEQLIANGADWRAKLGTEGRLALQDLLYEVQGSKDAKAGLTSPSCWRTGWIRICGRQVANPSLISNFDAQRPC